MDNKMKAIILAAGIGSRLNFSNPKCMLKLPTGESLLERQVDIIKASGIDHIVIVVGFKKELIMEHVSNVSFVINEDYRITNTSKSLLAALRGLNEDVLWTNGDIVFDRQIIEQIANTQENIVVVNSAKCGEEEIKYCLNSQGSISQISKQVENPLGEALGINVLKQGSLHQFILALQECEDNDYFEKGMQILIDSGEVFKPLDVKTFRCIEIDSMKDWKVAQQLFSSE